MSKTRHAYLIIAHHEFEVLQKLIEALDDDRNDIYLHIDKKVKNLPVLHSKAARLIIIKNRVDVRWGHVSQIESEYALFEAAYYNQEKYERYHLLSGTHMPLKNQRCIHAFFDLHRDKEVMSSLYSNDYEANFKINRFHFFLREHRSNHALFAKISQVLWHISLKIQKILCIQKLKPRVRIKANNWVSLTSLAVRHILKEKKQTLKEFRYSFCGDEFFVPYLLAKTPGKFKILDEKRLLFNDFVGSTPRTITQDDYDFLITSDYLFARKFSSTDMGVVSRILKHIKLS